MLDRIALILVTLGALNWGALGIFQLDIIAWATGSPTSTLARVIYTVIALAGVWCISLFFRERNVVLEGNDREYNNVHRD